MNLFMLSKNNRQQQLQKQQDRKQRFTIKRVSVGVASVLLGATFMMNGSNASADQVEGNQANDGNNDASQASDQAATTTAAVDQNQNLSAAMLAESKVATPVEDATNNAITPAPSSQKQANGQATITNGIEAQAQVQVNVGTGITDQRQASYELHMQIDPQAAGLKSGDTMTVTFDQLGDPSVRSY